MKLTKNSHSYQLSLDEVVNRLAESPLVDGLALFGSRTGPVMSPASDIDLLILVQSMPVAIFQMFTSIGGTMADILFVETEIADQVLARTDRVQASSFEGLFITKMASAQILYDRSGRLTAVQDSLTHSTPIEDRLLPSSFSAIYSAWFWHNHTLSHLKRLLQSDDPVYQTAVDMMLLTGLREICRAYCTVRSIPWEGEKSAIRYLADHDPEFLAQFRQTLAASQREQKVDLYEQMVKRVLEPAGELWLPGITAVYLRDPEQHETEVETALKFWEDFFL